LKFVTLGGNLLEALENFENLQTTSWQTIMGACWSFFLDVVKESLFADYRFSSTAVSWASITCHSFLYERLFYRDLETI